MNDNNKKPELLKPLLGEAEFTALRAEIMQRAQFQQQLVNLSVIIAGTLLTIFFQFAGPSWILLIYPLLALFMAMEWSFNNSRIMQIGRYIRDEIENKWAGQGWENYLQSPRSQTSLHWLSGAIFAYGTFIGLPIVVIVLAVLNRFSWTTPESFLFAVDSAIALIVIPFVVRHSEINSNREYKNR
jgi:hypothetical protein